MQPNKDFQPVCTGILFSREIDNKDLLDGLVDLSNRGFLTISDESNEGN